MQPRNSPANALASRLRARVAELMGEPPPRQQGSPRRNACATLASALSTKLKVRADELRPPA
jgi:hypothetical protein